MSSDDVPAADGSDEGVQDMFVNMCPVKEGCVVEVFGLQAPVSHIDGDKADVITVHADGHYEIRMHVDSTTKKIRAEQCKPYAALGESLPRPITQAPDAPETFFKEG